MKENFPAVNRFLAIDPGRCPNRACIRLSQQRRLRDRMPGGPGRIRLGLLRPATSASSRSKEPAEHRNGKSVRSHNQAGSTTRFNRTTQRANRSPLTSGPEPSPVVRPLNRAFDDRNDASGCGPANKAHDVYAIAEPICSTFVLDNQDWRIYILPASSRAVPYEMIAT